LRSAAFVLETISCNPAAATRLKREQATTNPETGCGLKEATMLPWDRRAWRREPSSGREDAAITPRLTALLPQTAVNRLGYPAVDPPGTAVGLPGITSAFADGPSAVAAQARGRHHRPLACREVAIPMEAEAIGEGDGSIRMGACNECPVRRTSGSSGRSEPEDSLEARRSTGL
jgi:hypothetical protein